MWIKKSAQFDADSPRWDCEVYSRWRGHGTCRGVTFLEIMVVVTILGVLIAVAAPSLKGRSQRVALAGVSRELAVACNFARQAAISKQHEVWLKFDLEGSRWRIDLRSDLEMEDEDRRSSRPSEENRSDVEDIHELPRKISFKSLETDAPDLEIQGIQYPVVIFYPDGTSTGLTAEIESERGKRMTVEISPTTGRPQVYRGKKKSFRQKLAAMGIDASRFGADEEEPVINEDGEIEDIHDRLHAQRLERERAQRENYYQGALARILDNRRRQALGKGRPNAQNLPPNARPQNSGHPEP